APQVEDVLAQPAVGAEHLFVVVQPVASLAGQEQGGHGPQVEIAVALLEDGTEVDNGIDVCIRPGEAADRRAWRGGKGGGEGMKGGRGGGRGLGGGEKREGATGGGPCGGAGFGGG